MKTKVFGMLAFVMVALAGTGIAYGHWYDYAYINATITSGYIDVNLSDDLQPTITGGCTDCLPYYPTATQSLDSGTNTLTITITNAYPSICVNGTFDIQNDGTVPAELVSVTPTTVADNISGIITIVPINDHSVYLNDNGVNMMKICWQFVNPAGQIVTSNELCPGQEVFVHYKICFLEPLEQSTQFTIQLTWLFQNCEPVGFTPSGTA